MFTLTNETQRPPVINELKFTTIIGDNEVRKTISIDNGELKKSSVGLESGIAKTMSMSPLAFGNYLTKFQAHNLCISTGINIFAENDQYEIVSKRELSGRYGCRVYKGLSLQPYAKDKKTFKYTGNRFGILHIDVDPKEGMKHIQPQDLIPLLEKLCPNLKKCHIITKYSSSNVTINGVANPNAGYHLYYIVPHYLIQHIGMYLYHELWANGYGHIYNSVTGSQLEGGYIDKAVFSPERIIYTANPILIDESLSLNTASITTRIGDTEFYNCGDWSEFEALANDMDTVSNEIRKAKANNKGLSIEISEQYRVENKQTLLDDGHSETDVEEIIHRRLNGELSINDKVCFDDHGWMIIKDAMQQKYHGCTCSDPLEFNHPKNGGPNKAIFFPNLGKDYPPIINSMIHGGITYKISTDSYTTQKQASSQQTEPEKHPFESYQYEPINVDTNKPCACISWCECETPKERYQRLKTHKKKFVTQGKQMLKALIQEHQHLSYEDIVAGFKTKTVLDMLLPHRHNSEYSVSGSDMRDMSRYYFGQWGRLRMVQGFGETDQTIEYECNPQQLIDIPLSNRATYHPIAQMLFNEYADQRKNKVRDKNNLMQSIGRLLAHCHAYNEFMFARSVNSLVLSEKKKSGHDVRADSQYPELMPLHSGLVDIVNDMVKRGWIEKIEKPATIRIKGRYWEMVDILRKANVTVNKLHQPLVQYVDKNKKGKALRKKHYEDTDHTVQLRSMLDNYNELLSKYRIMRNGKIQDTLFELIFTLTEDGRVSIPSLESKTLSPKTGKWAAQGCIMDFAKMSLSDSIKAVEKIGGVARTKLKHLIRYQKANDEIKRPSYKKNGLPVIIITSGLMLSPEAKMVLDKTHPSFDEKNNTHWFLKDYCHSAQSVKDDGSCPFG